MKVESKMFQPSIDKMNDNRSPSPVGEGGLPLGGKTGEVVIRHNTICANNAATQNPFLMKGF